MILTIRTATLSQFCIEEGNTFRSKQIKRKVVIKANGSQHQLYKYPSLKEMNFNFDQKRNCPLLIPDGYYKMRKGNITNLNMILYQKLNEKSKRQLPSINIHAKHLPLTNKSYKWFFNGKNQQMQAKEQLGVINDHCDLFTNIQESIDSFTKAIKVKNVNKHSSDVNDELTDEKNSKSKEKKLWLTRSRNINNAQFNNLNHCVTNKQSTISPFLNRNLSMINCSSIADLINQSNTIKFKKDPEYLQIKKKEHLIKSILNHCLV